VKARALLPPELRGPLLAGALVTIAAWTVVVATPVYRHWLFGDARYFENWGNWMTEHQVPYRDFQIEYPPGALPTFVAPVYLRKLAGYHGTYFFWLWFEVLIFALLILPGMAWALARLGASRRRLYAALCAAAVTPVLLGPVAIFHFDYLPAAFAVAAVAALVARRGVLACALAAAGAAVKVFPIVLVPFALFELWRHGRWRAVGKGIAAAAAVLAAAFVPFLVVAPHGLTWALHRQVHRPLEIESIGASFFTAAHELAGLHVHVIVAAASHNFAGDGPDAVATALGVATLVALAAVYALYLRGPRTPERLVLGCATAVTAYVVLSKVFSPQYLVWLVPLVPLVGGRRGLRASVLLLVILGTTQIYEPYHQEQYWTLGTAWVNWLVIARNVLVVALLAVLVWPGEQTPGAAAARVEPPERP
jgi:uncharacterized membrane protein